MNSAKRRLKELQEALGESQKNQSVSIKKESHNQDKQEDHYGEKMLSQSVDAAEERIYNMGKIKSTLAVVTGQFFRFNRLKAKARDGKMDMGIASMKIDKMFR